MNEISNLSNGGGGGILFSPLVIVIFLTVFGGIGMILSKSSTISIGILIIIASGLGITISYIIDRFVIRALKKAQNPSYGTRQESKSSSSSLSWG